MAIFPSEGDRQVTNPTEMCQHRLDLKSVSTGGIETKQKKVVGRIIARVGIILFFFPQRGSSKYDSGHSKAAWRM